MKRKTLDYRKTARIVGILYIIGTLAGVLSVQFLKIRNEPDLFAAMAGNPGYLETGAVLTLIMGVALALIPVLMFPILKEYNEALGVGYIVFRSALETGLYITQAICVLALSSLNAAYTSASPGAAFASAGQEMLTGAGAANATGGVEPLIGAGAALKALTDASVTPFIFGAGALIFYFALYKYRLIPRWLSAFGLAAILLHIVSGALVLYGLQRAFDAGSLVMNMPIAVQEMVMAVWLIVKGFTGAASEPARYD